MSTRFKQLERKQGEADTHPRSRPAEGQPSSSHGAENNPGVIALKALEARANGGPRVHQQRALQARAGEEARAGRTAQLREAANRGASAQRKAGARNTTGMPDGLKTGLEQMSGMDLSGVRVHYNSSRPAQLNAYAYTQGQDIHVAPGQERHLPHEGWHVVQQMQGRVAPTTESQGVAINDDRGLEREADRLGQKALSLKARPGASPTRPGARAAAPVQAVRKNKKGGKNTDGTPFEQAVRGLPGETFLADDFAFNHIMRTSKLKGRTAQDFALQEGARRGLGRQTVLFMEGQEYRGLLQEATERNASRFYLKKIKKAGGVPAQTFFVSDGVFHYVTVAPGAGGYTVDQEGLGRIRYTVKNAGTVDKTNVYKINHLEEILPVSALETDSAEAPEYDDEEGSEEGSEVEAFSDWESDYDEDDFGTAQFKQGPLTPGSAPVQRAGIRVEPEAVAGGPAVQRQVFIGEGDSKKEYDVDGAMNAIFGKNLIKDLSTANAITEVIEQFVKKNRSFTSVEEMFETAKAELENESESDEEEAADGEIEFPPELWDGEAKKLRETNLKTAGYRKGSSLRAQQGLDYKTVDKDAFEVEGREDRTLVIRLNRPRGAGSITQEIRTLSALGKNGFPVAEIKQVGYYPLGGVAHPAMVMRRYVNSSKALLRRVRKKTQRNEDWTQNIAFLNTPKKVKTAIQSLKAIMGQLQSSPDSAVDDIQFLIKRNGEFVINDASETNAKHIEANVEVIGDLLGLLAEHLETVSGS